VSARASSGIRFALLGLAMLAAFFAKGCATDGYYTDGYYTGGGMYGNAYYGDFWYWNDCCYRHPGGMGPPPARPSPPIARPPRPMNPVAIPPSRPMPMPRPSVRR